MIRPLTRDERRAWQLGTEDIATNARGFVSIEVLAMNRRRYEATLRAQDEVIAALVVVCAKILDWLENAPVSYANGIKAPSGQDEGEVLGGQWHRELEEEVRNVVAKAQGDKRPVKLEEDDDVVPF